MFLFLLDAILAQGGGFIFPHLERKMGWPRDGRAVAMANNKLNVFHLSRRWTAVVTWCSTLEWWSEDADVADVDQWNLGEDREKKREAQTRCVFLS